MTSSAALSIIIPTLNAAGGLRACLSALAPAALDGVVREVIICDGGSTDDTLAIAREFGATVMMGAVGRGAQMALGATAARGEWLMFLHADTRLQASWTRALEGFMRGGARPDDDQWKNRAGVFTLAFDDLGAAPTIVAWGARIRARVLRTPYGDQGFVIHRNAYREIGGYAAIPLFEDVDIVRRFTKTYGRRALVIFPATALTSAARYRQDGYFMRVARNFCCLALYHAGVAPEKIKSVYEQPTFRRENH